MIMKRTAVKLLILFVATGLLPWVAFAIGQVGSKIALYAHVTGIVAVMVMKIWDLFKERRNSRPLDDKGSDRVNESPSDEPPSA